jgi:hypothetical protein
LAVRAWPPTFDPRRSSTFPAPSNVTLLAAAGCPLASMVSFRKPVVGTNCAPGTFPTNAM